MPWDKQEIRRMLCLYAVTDGRWAGRYSLLEQAEQALSGGATCIQLREKELEDDAFLRRAKQMRALCSRFGVPLIINDRLDIALACGADGVHLGQDDMTPGQARRHGGRDLIIGVTAKTIPQALVAQDAGADYLGSGAIFGTTTKPGALPMTREALAGIAGAVSIPVVAIGGINRGNLPLLSGLGVCGAAVASGVFAAQDIKSECALLRSLADQAFGEVRVGEVRV